MAKFNKVSFDYNIDQLYNMLLGSEKNVIALLNEYSSKTKLVIEYRIDTPDTKGKKNYNLYYVCTVTLQDKGVIARAVSTCKKQAKVWAGEKAVIYI